jgi:hypothetical protein
MAIRIGIVTVGLIVQVLWDNPSLATIIVLAVIAVILLLVVEMMRVAAVHSRPA